MTWYEWVALGPASNLGPWRLDLGPLTHIRSITVKWIPVFQQEQFRESQLVETNDDWSKVHRNYEGYNGYYVNTVCFCEWLLVTSRPHDTIHPLIIANIHNIYLIPTIPLNIFWLLLISMNSLISANSHYPLLIPTAPLNIN